MIIPQQLQDSIRGEDLIQLMRHGHVHFMGIGGSGMCALAELFVRDGGEVSGCDISSGAIKEHFRSMNVTVHDGHECKHLEEVDALVISAAVPLDHSEIQEAHSRGIPVLKRSEALGMWVNRGEVLAIAGTHGKTSTTAMATEILAEAGLNPTGIVGGRVSGWDSNMRYGSDLYVVEADEYDRSFLNLEPKVAVVTNLEADHLDTYGNIESVIKAFCDFLGALSKEGRGIICGDDYGASKLLGILNGRGYTYGTSAGSQLRGVDIKTKPGSIEFRIVEDGFDKGIFSLSVPGVHNLRNALGAAAAARYFEVSWEDIRRSLMLYKGVGRRFEIVGLENDILLVDDYAHHPSEISATLEAARDSYPDRRIVAIFQPHLFSRTQDFADDFGRALAGADVIWVTSIFPAREEPIPGVTGALISTAAEREGGNVKYHSDLDTIADVVASDLMPGDLLVTMGAGSIEYVPGLVLNILKECG
tara:strand:- start:30 stop:1454 length:1425 start_codon:yes stop_codon:yes gene_type:complete